MVIRLISIAGAPVVALLLIACGGTDEGRGDLHARPGDTSAGPRIAAPAHGSAAKLDTTGGEGRARIALRGTAPPRSRVKLTLGCQPTPCSTTVTATANGTWAVRAPVRMNAKQRELSISADADPRATSAATDLVVVRVASSDALAAANPREVSRIKAREERDRRRQRQAESALEDEFADDVHVVTTIEPGGDSVGPDQTPAGGGGGQGGSTAPVVLIGDSLAQGIAPLLPAALGGAGVSVDAARGRSLAAGMALVRRAPRGSRLAISLFTNDDPRAIGSLEQAVRDSAAVAGGSGCAVWATIVRPPLAGATYDSVNRLLQRLAADRQIGSRVRIVQWAAAIRANPSWLTGDGVHATAAGYRGLATLYAEALQSC